MNVDAVNICSDDRAIVASSQEMPLKARKFAIITQQISEYHRARFHATAERCEDLTIIAAVDNLDLVMSQSHGLVGFRTIVLFRDRAEYLHGVRRGHVWRKVVSALDSLLPDVVAVAGWAFPESLSAMHWASKNNARIVMMSDSQFGDSFRPRLREMIKKRIVSASDAALVAGSPHLDYVAMLGMEKERIFIGYDVVDNDYFTAGAAQARANKSAISSSLGLPDRYLLASGRFIHKKNFPALIRAFGRALKRTDSPHHLIILGEGDDRGEIQSSVISEGLEDRVLMPGMVGYDILPRYYGLAEAFVHVSLVEQWGLVVNEAAASGLPIVVSNRCGSSFELVEHGRNGFICEPDNIDSISTALCDIMSLSSEQKAYMSTQSVRIINNWGLERYVKGITDASDCALKNPPRVRKWLNSVLFWILAHRFYSRVS